jgi:hypothetical protein
MRTLAAALIIVSIIACAAIALQGSKERAKPKAMKSMGAAKTFKKQSE